MLVVLLACLSGTIVGLAVVWGQGKSFQHRLPFGTFLGAAGIVVLLVGDAILEWYEHLVVI
jgi:prepilin signal peptidase PulO-like enzyme (type II secretory pathway)